MIKIDSQSNGRLVHRYLAYTTITKFCPETQKPLWVKSGYKIQWKNIWADLKMSFVPALAFRLGVPLEFAYQLGAIALDSANVGTNSGGVLAASITWNHVTAASAVLVIGVQNHNVVPGNITYNGTNTTFGQDSPDDYAKLYYTLSPTSGTKAVVINASTVDYLEGFSISFTGADTSTIGANANGGGTGGVSNATITTTRNNSFCVSIDYIQQPGAITSYDDGQTPIVDQAGGPANAYRSVGSYLQVATSGTNQRIQYSHGNVYWQTTILEVLQAISGPTNVKTWDGIAIANVKTINSVAIANVKTINGVT